LSGGGAIEVADQEALLSAMRKCLSEEEFAGRIALAGRNIIRRNQGATQKTLDALAGLLKMREVLRDQSSFRLVYFR
jgi:3-deoxy-D-manno-octulosonic-acid transferase